MSVHSIATPTTTIETIGPTASSERIQIIDILRGFALFGILIVNMAFFKASFMPGQPPITAHPDPINQFVAQMIDLLAEGKFFTLFSFLFGLGFAIQIIRAQQKGISFGPRFMRRLLVLLVFGLAHVVLLWYGDILVSYALIGFVLVLFRNRSPRALLIWVAVILSAMTLLISAGVGLMELAQTVPEVRAEMEQVSAQMRVEAEQESARDLAIYSNGTYSAIMSERLQDYIDALFAALFMAPSVLSMFLLGLYAGKRGILQDVPAHLPLLRRVRFWGLLLGLIFNLGLLLAPRLLSPLSALFAQLLIFSIAGPLLSMGYAATVVLLAQHEHWRLRLAPLAATGRMALTNYLLQSLICTTIFYGYGFGLFGQVGAATGLLIAVVIYALQIPFSIWWLSRFQFGPMEWLWRSLTYGRVQPMRRPVPPATAS